jgi:hypothetical protein
MAPRRRRKASPQAKAPESQSEFKRFQDLARKVVAVPKKEVDEKRGKA